MVKRNDLKNDKVYYTFYMDMGNVRFKEYSGLVKIRKISNNNSNFFEILEAPDKFTEGSRQLRNLNYGIKFNCYEFYESWDEAAEAHDREIIETAERFETNIKQSLYKKLILLEAPKMTKLESDAVEWYENLTEKEREYVTWIKYYYSEV